jgi:phospholipid/cholesterol/gamma-HCH transport system substrate-binding protein
MQTRAPSLAQVAIAVGFALSCFGLLLFLWLAFGGPVPLKAQGYRVTVPVKEASQLGAEADVRISGVPVGKVKSVDLGDGNAADAVIEIDEDYAPIAADTRAILRQKTLLGETYVELTPGSPEGPTVPEGGELAAAQVSEAVQLDEVFRTFDEPTREGLRVWMQDGARAVRGRAPDLNAALGNLDPFTEEGARLMRTLDRQRLAVSGLLDSSGEVFEALSERRGALRGLITNSERVFATTAARDRELAETFRILPTFLDESEQTLGRLEQFAVETDPLITQLRPVARELGPTVVEVERLAPRMERFFDGLLPVTRLAPRGLASLRGLLDDNLPPLLTRLTPFMKELTPVLVALRRYRREVTAFLGNTAAATNAYNSPAESNFAPVRYLRTTAPLHPEELAGYPQRLRINRTNPYVKPGGYRELRRALESFSTGHCANGINARLDPATADQLPGDLFERIREYVFNGELNSNAVPAPRCVAQEPFRSIGGPPRERSSYLHVRPDE